MAKILYNYGVNFNNLHTSNLFVLPYGRFYMMLRLDGNYGLIPLKSNSNSTVCYDYQPACPCLARLRPVWSLSVRHPVV